LIRDHRPVKTVPAASTVSVNSGIAALDLRNGLEWAV